MLASYTCTIIPATRTRLVDLSQPWRDLSSIFAAFREGSAAQMTGVGKRKKPTAPYCCRLRGLGVSAQKLTSGRSPVFRSDAFRPRTEQREVLRAREILDLRMRSMADGYLVLTPSTWPQSRQAMLGRDLGRSHHSMNKVPRASGSLHKCCIFLRRSRFSRLSIYG